MSERIKQSKDKDIRRDKDGKPLVKTVLALRQALDWATQSADNVRALAHSDNGENMMLHHLELEEAAVRDEHLRNAAEHRVRSHYQNNHAEATTDGIEIISQQQSDEHQQT